LDSEEKSVEEWFSKQSIVHPSPIVRKEEFATSLLAGGNVHHITIAQNFTESSDV
jgi:hypothetical protein